METMLSKALREFTTGPLNQLIVNLGGQDADQWEEELKKWGKYSMIGHHTFDDIISIINLFTARQEFESEKKNKLDVANFALRLHHNIFELHEDLVKKVYKHGRYEAFSINDPKPRIIHKATVRDRVLHHAIYRILYPFFDKIFIYDSYSCRKYKGTHRAISRYESFISRITQNGTKTAWSLKCDIRKFFASVDQPILMGILRKHLDSEDLILLLSNIVESFCSTQKGKGLPLGNLTSQLLVNIYMNEFDQFMKHVLGEKYYIRYADDFVILNNDQGYLMERLAKIGDFLQDNLKLSLHPDKIILKTVQSGVDFLGWIVFPTHKILRTSTKRRMLHKLKDNYYKKSSVTSYLGMLQHGDAYEIQKELIKNSEHYGTMWQ